MAVKGSYELVRYYANLLILQYAGKPDAFNHVCTAVIPALAPQQTTVQEIIFSSVAVSGSFELSWNNSSPVTIYWNDNAAGIQTKLRTISALAAVTVTGSIASKSVVVNMVNMSAPAMPMEVGTNSLQGAVLPVKVTVDGIDETLPLAVQNGFNLIGAKPAVGTQLDTLGKYAGVTRSGPGFFGQITLGDADFLQLIRMALIKNNSGSSLADIQDYLYTFFPGQVFVYDYANMQLGYAVSTAIGSTDLVQLFIMQKLLPRPMTVGVGAVIYAPVLTNFLVFVTYTQPTLTNGKGANTYDSYDMDSPWLTYNDLIVAP